MTREGRAPAVAALVLLFSGLLGVAGTARMGLQYAQGARTLSSFDVGVEVAAVSPTLELSLRYHNPGPWPVKLLEVQVLAWHRGDYLGAASRDLRQDPLLVAPASIGQLNLAFPRGPQAGLAPSGKWSEGEWRFRVSGRMELPVMGSCTFSREAVLAQTDGRSR